MSDHLLKPIRSSFSHGFPMGNASCFRWGLSNGRGVCSSGAAERRAESLGGSLGGSAQWVIVDSELGELHKRLYITYNMCIYIYIHVYVWLYVYIYIYMYVCVHTYISIHIHICIYIDRYMDVHMYIHMYMYTYIYIYMWVCNVCMYVM